MKIVAGADSRLLEASLDSGARGIVLEALGRGNVPPEVVPGVRRWVEAGRPLVITSRSMRGRVLDTYAYPGGGHVLREMGAIFADHMTGQQARIELMLAIGVHGGDTVLAIHDCGDRTLEDDVRNAGPVVPYACRTAASNRPVSFQYRKKSVSPRSRSSEARVVRRLRVAWTFAVPDRLESWGAALEVTPLVVRGRELFRSDGTPVRRIYNRVVFDELIQKNIQLPFDYRQELDVEWAPTAGSRPACVRGS